MRREVLCVEAKRQQHCKLTDVSIDFGVESGIAASCSGTIQRSGTTPQVDSHSATQSSNGNRLAVTSPNGLDTTFRVFKLDYESVIWDRARHPGLPEVVLA